MAMSVGPRERKVRILATLGPGSSSREMIAKLMACGADAFRINMSHGDQASKAKLVETIRALEVEHKRPSCILFDLQGPKLRVGQFAEGSAQLETGARFILDADTTPGSAERVELPHPELFEAVREGDQLLIDDGKIRLRVAAVTATRIETIVEVGGKVSNNKGVNVPDVLVPIPALTEKDRDDLQFALAQGADYIAFSFVQRPEDVEEARALIGDKAALLVKIEKPAAIERLEGILALADAVMVARGDLGVELPAEAVPPLQKMIVARARELGKPVVVATQMLESMITSPTPTRAEVSDVANAIYDGADAIMLSAESAAGAVPDRSGAHDGPDRPLGRSRSRICRAGPFHRHPGRTQHRRRAGRKRGQHRQHRQGRGDGLLHLDRLDRPPHRARARAGAAAGDDRQPAGRAAAWASSGASTPSTPAMSRASRRWSARPSAWCCATSLPTAGSG